MSKIKCNTLQQAACLSDFINLEEGYASFISMSGVWTVITTASQSLIDQARQVVGV